MIHMFTIGAEEREGDGGAEAEGSIPGREWEETGEIRDEVKRGVSAVRSSVTLTIPHGRAGQEQRRASSPSSLLADRCQLLHRELSMGTPLAPSSTGGPSNVGGEAVYSSSYFQSSDSGDKFST